MIRRSRTTKHCSDDFGQNCLFRFKLARTFFTAWRPELIFNRGSNEPLICQGSRLALKLWALLGYLQKQSGAILPILWDLSHTAKL
jgi:hypothetical protein